MLRDRRLWLLLGTAAVVLGFCASRDFAWSLAIQELSSAGFVATMGRSLFEGDLPGVGDIATCLALGSLAAYVASWLGTLQYEPTVEPWWRWQRSELGCIVFCVVMVGLGGVHACKMALGRVRPDALLAGKGPYSQFFELMPATAWGAWGDGSFPSGHTATMMTLLVFVYLGWRDEAHGTLRRRLMVGVVLVGALLMGLARVMAARHWVGDVVASIFMTWIVVHVSYYHLLNIPAQRLYMLKYGCEAPHVRFWELRFAGALLTAMWAIAGVIFAARLALGRSADGSSDLGMPLAAAAGLTVIAALALQAARRMRRRALDTLGEAPVMKSVPGAVQAPPKVGAAQDRQVEVSP